AALRVARASAGSYGGQPSTSAVSARRRGGLAFWGPVPAGRCGGLAHRGLVPRREVRRAAGPSGRFCGQRVWVPQALRGPVPAGRRGGLAFRGPVPAGRFGGPQALRGSWFLAALTQRSCGRAAPKGSPKVLS